MYTDKLGLIGASAVFPEFQPVQKRLLEVITLGHYIDHICDEGKHGKLPGKKTDNISQFNHLYTELLHHFGQSPIVRSLIVFFGHALVVESTVKEFPPTTDEASQQ